MVELVAAIAFAPWTRPPHFRPLAGWQAGASRTISSSYGPVPGVGSPKEATAWMARGVAYQDSPKADPPDQTLSHLPRRGVVVFAVVYQAPKTTEGRIRLQLSGATHYPCCDGTSVPGGMYGLAGAGPRDAYSVIVRVYFGSPPTRAMRAEAQQALDRLELPVPR